MLTPKTHADLVALVEGRVQESLTLEYKRIHALNDPDEICRDVSGMANSQGGTIIYGVREDKQHFPEGIDVGDTGPHRREWLENILTSRVSPKMDGVIILPVELDTGGFAYVVTVPQASSRAPHQAPDSRYYKRHNFKREPMADYEVRDVLRRAERPQLVGVLRFAPPGPRSIRDTPIPIIAVARNASDSPVLYAHTRVTLDNRLVFHHHDGFQPSSDLGDTLPVATSFDHMTVVPNSPPIFRGVEVRLGGAVRVSVPRPYTDDLYRVSLRISCPGQAFVAEGAVRVTNEMVYLDFPDFEAY